MPRINGWIALMRELDVAITMRFHAAIYAQKKKLSVIGVDYRVGIKHKVAALLDDFREKRKLPSESTRPRLIGCSTGSANCRQGG